MVTRDFDAMLAERAGVRPTFRIGGQEFTAKAKLPFRKFQTMLASFASDDVDEDQATDDFFKLVIIRADRERFFELLNRGTGPDSDDDDDDENVIAVEQVNGLTKWLMDLYTGKQNASSTSSSDGSETTGAKPNVVSLNSRTQTA